MYYSKEQIAAVLQNDEQKTDSCEEAVYIATSTELLKASTWGTGKVALLTSGFQDGPY